MPVPALGTLLPNLPKPSAGGDTVFHSQLWQAFLNFLNLLKPHRLH